MLLIFSALITVTKAVSLVTWIGKINDTYIISSFNSLDPKLKRFVYTNSLRVIQDNFGFLYTYEEPGGLLTPVDDIDRYSYNYSDDDFIDLNLTLNWITINNWRCT